MLAGGNICRRVRRGPAVEPTVGREFVLLDMPKHTSLQVLPIDLVRQRLQIDPNLVAVPLNRRLGRVRIDSGDLAAAGSHGRAQGRQHPGKARPSALVDRNL
jgi:hypothetical protein